MINLDIIFNSLHKRQKYLGWRCFILVLVLIFSYFPTISAKNLSDEVFLNTTLLLILPFFLDYFLGFDAYNIYTNVNRILGFLFSLGIIIFCIIGYMGGFHLTYGENNYIEGIKLFGYVISLNILKNICWFIPGFALVDFVFTLSPREIRFYKLQDKLTKQIHKSLKEEKHKNTYEEKVKETKVSLMEMVENVKTADSERGS